MKDCCVLGSQFEETEKREGCKIGGPDRGIRRSVHGIMKLQIKTTKNH